MKSLWEIEQINLFWCIKVWNPYICFSYYIFFTDLLKNPSYELISIFKIDLLFKRESYRETGSYTHNESSLSISGLLPRWCNSQSKKHGTPSGFSHERQDPKHADHLLLPSKVQQQAVVLKMEQPKFKHVLTRDTSIIIG